MTSVGIPCRSLRIRGVTLNIPGPETGLFLRISSISMRSHYCGQVNETLLDQEVRLAGWVHRRRDHGGVIFVDLRDREGLVQVVFDPDRAELFADAEKLRHEFVVRVR